MSGTFTSWGALVQALQKEVAEATEEVVDDSLTICTGTLADFTVPQKEDITVQECCVCHHRVTSAVAVLCLQVRSV